MVLEGPFWDGNGAATSFRGNASYAALKRLAAINYSGTALEVSSTYDSAFGLERPYSPETDSGPEFVNVEGGFCGPPIHRHFGFPFHLEFQVLPQVGGVG